MTLATGRFNRVVAVDRPMTVTAPNNDELVEFAEDFTAHACIEPIRGREGQRGDGILAELDTKITLRYNQRNARITEKWRMRYKGTTYNIASVIDVDMAHRELEFACSSGVNRG